MHGGKLIFTNRFIKGIWHRKFKSHTVDYDIMIIVTLIKMSLSSSSGKKNCEATLRSTCVTETSNKQDKLKSSEYK